MDCSNLNIDSPPSWSNDYEILLRGPFNYLAENPGKNLRSVLIESFNQILNVPLDKVHEIEKIVDFLHISSLMVDDVEDNATLRRSLPATHTVFGIAQTINTANYMYFEAMRLLDITFKFNEILKKKAFVIFNTEMINLHRGQGLDLYWRDSLVVPTESEYINMVMNKTGGLFRLSVKLLELLSPNKIVIDLIDPPSASPSLLVSLANLLGIIYQIRDDYLNLKSIKYNENKGFCEDITEGKFSFLILHSINSNPNNKELINILKLKTTDIELKKHALRCMELTNTFQYVKDSLNNLNLKSQSLINNIIQIYFPPNKSNTDNSETIKLVLLSTISKLSSI
ncbi:hypothetical protein B5S31_g4207 [[Candida] boidinii]|uniref:Unnamed protein product n=1 Tax=Candida boidinii TaxID=5477 RepID=A0ACB5U4U9_CANBO|nr:hypothetical protein B5S29_g3310 [[Candida] boidinii]OWB74415.1 hypothetical protein B5S31_g4207 [[Candida] boidinii]GMF01351.1 unnamed protein product [[Candida] boidinii]GMF04017.1 unnamed protein product [[Candida] boidinii]